MGKFSNRIADNIKRNQGKNMLTIFDIPAYDENAEDQPGNWIGRLLFDIVNNNPFYELKDRENSRRIEAFDLELRKGMIRVKQDNCSLCGREKTDYWKLKPEGHKFVVEKAVAETIKEASKALFPKLIIAMSRRRNATEDFLDKLTDVTLEQWNSMKAS